MGSFEIIKKRLKECIKESGLTTVEIASKIGVSSGMVTQYCTTQKLSRLDTFADLCKVLNVSADYILGIGNY